MAKRLTILGSTGSIGRSALQVLRHLPGRFQIVGLSAHQSIDELAQQAVEFSPQYVAVGADAAALEAKARAAFDCPLLEGEAGVVELAAQPADLVLCAIVGAAGLKPLLAAIEAGNNVAIANKEPLVIAGELIMETARRHGVTVLPVDSEHNAIFQCLSGHDTNDVYKVWITASGGPFYGEAPEQLAAVTPEQAARHPRWDMGVKISVDSATLMNKGLEIIEAMWLFGLPLEKIAPVIHPQSIVHSLVEFNDGHFVAHLGPTDMKFPIQFALTWPERLAPPMQRLDLASLGALTFDRPDFSEFPCLAYAIDAAREGGTAPAVLNAANETAVAAFCAHEIGFLSIARVAAAVMNVAVIRHDMSLEAVMEADAYGRRLAREVIAKKGQAV